MLKKRFTYFHFISFLIQITPIFSTSTGTILYLPSSTVSYCQPQSLLHTDAGWSSLESTVNNDHSGRVLDLISRDANIQRSSFRADEVTIKLAKDTSTGNMFTGALYRSADLANGGTYEVMQS